MSGNHSEYALVLAGLMGISAIACTASSPSPSSSVIAQAPPRVESQSMHISSAERAVASLPGSPIGSGGALHDATPSTKVDVNAAAPRDPVLTLQFASIPESLSDRTSMTNSTESAVTLRDVWHVIWTRSISLVDGILQLDGLVDAHNQSGAVLFTVDSAEGLVPLGMHATQFGGRGVEEWIHRLVPAPDGALVFVLIAETCSYRGAPDFMGSEPETDYLAFVASTRDVRRVIGAPRFVDPQLANEAFTKGATDQVVDGCHEHRQTTYRIDFQHARLIPIATRRCH